MPKGPVNEIDGLLLVDKPQDWTSHDVVNCVRSRFRLGRVGHCGTLDPMATGLLVLLLGRGTKWQEHFMGEDKVYAGSLMLGVETDSEDATGAVVATHPWEQVTEVDLKAAAASLTGEILQVPPMVSAIKVNGKALYKLARKGQVIEREPRPVTIHRFDITMVDLPRADFIVHCSKGTYIRTLCADLGRKLGCGAHMSALRRLECGPFSVADAVDMETLKGCELADFMARVRPLPNEQAL